MIRNYSNIIIMFQESTSTITLVEIRNRTFGVNFRGAELGLIRSTPLDQTVFS